MPGPARPRDFRPSWASLEGLPFPLGVAWIAEEDAWNFAVYSEHAERVTLLLYGEEDSASPILARRLDHLRNKSGPVWHCRIRTGEMRGARFYAYQVDGPRAPYPGFDPDKILFDPYARALHYFPPGFDRKAATGPGANAGRAPLGLIAADRESFDWGDDGTRRHEADAVIYELHVRGFTAHPSSGVVQERRGTFAGLIEKIPYLLELGVTIVELMPVFQFDPGEGRLLGLHADELLRAPQRLRAPARVCDQHTEFRDGRRAARGRASRWSSTWSTTTPPRADHTGPVYSFKGHRQRARTISSSGRPDAPYADFSGTGNTLDCAQPLRPRDDPRQHALLGPRDARRRVPLRSRLGVRAADRWLTELRGPADLRRDRRRRRPRRPAPDRGTVGCGRRLPAGPRLPGARVAAVERPVPRRRAPVRARRRRDGAGA